MNVSAWAGQVGVSKYTACRWYHAGRLPVPARRAGRQIMILDLGEVEGDLVRDMTEVLIWFCARLCGRRGAGNRVLRALGCAQTGTSGG